MIKSTIKWWEKKRLWYNIIIGAIGVLTLLDVATHFNLIDFVYVIIWGIGANIFFSLGILVEIFDFYYFKKKLKLYKFRWLFLIAGILISCYLTIINILIYYNQLIIG